MTIITNRRILHQPFFPDTSSSSSSSTSSSSPPFFPSYDSTPPPPTITQPLTPPSPSAFASFPANVSSIDIPRSPKSGNSVSPSLLAVTIVSVLLAVSIVSIALYYYCKRRHKHLCEGSDTKTCRSDNNSHRLYPNSATGNVVVTATTHVESGFDDDDDDGVRKVRSNSSTRPTSTEFLYLGTIASSGLIGDRGGRDSGDLSSGDIGGDLAERKLDSSPELRPLPPLARYGGNSGNVEFHGEEEDEFYSPNGSYYSVDGSGSGRVFAAVAAAAVVEMVGMRSETSTSSCSSSNLGSPIRLKTDGIDSPASLDHHRSSPSLSSSPSPPTESLPGRRGVYATQPQPPHPPPPPPPPLAARNMESRTPSPPSILQPVSKPPGLIISPPKPTPIVSQNPTRVSSPATLVAEKSEDETTKPKLKPLHWDKVGASSDREMVWDQLKSSSFKLNEEMIESLFVVNTSNSSAKETARRSILPSPVQDCNRIFDPKKSQNIAISLRALNVTAEEIREVLLEGNADTLGAELLESLLKMAPSKEEERKLKEFGDDSTFKLGPAERFLKEVLGIPFAFQRIDVMLYMANFESEVEYLKSSFTTLEAACEELRNSRILFKLLEAVLKTGNRMNVGTNRGDAHAFKLDTLLKLVDVKAADGKTTLLHFVVQEIIKSEGARLSDSYNNQVSISTTPTLNEDARCRKLGLQVVSNLRSELTNVKKAAAMDSTVLTGEVVKLSNGIENIKGVVTTLIGEGNVKFSDSANKFVSTAEEEIIRVQAQESVSLSLVKEITEYFHGNSAKEEAHPFRIFTVVRDFLTVLDRVCKDVGTINDRTIVSSAHKFPVPVNPTIQHSLPGTH